MGNKSRLRKKSKIRNRGKKIRQTKKRKVGGYHKDTIPRIVHQIWFGSDVPSWRRYIFDEVRKVCERNGYIYKLWTEKERTRKHFPITYPYQQDAIQIGKELGQNRYAQVADLARLEIIYHQGGIYLDSIFLIRDAFFNEIEKKNLCEGNTFICANEDPCELDCQNSKGEKYLSNSFFAASVRHPVLERLLNVDNDDNLLDQVDLHSVEINKTTGPYFLRKGIHDPVEDRVGIFPMEKIYPFPMSGSTREPMENTCLTNTPTTTEDTVQVGNNRFLYKNCIERNPDALAVYLVGLGGTWSL